MRAHRAIGSSPLTDHKMFSSSDEPRGASVTNRARYLCDSWTMPSAARSKRSGCIVFEQRKITAVAARRIHQTQHPIVKSLTQSTGNSHCLRQPQACDRHEPWSTEDCLPRKVLRAEPLSALRCPKEPKHFLRNGVINGSILRLRGRAIHNAHRCASRLSIIFWLRGLTG